MQWYVPVILNSVILNRFPDCLKIIRGARRRDPPVLYNKYACSTSPRGVGSGSYKGGAVAREGRGCGWRHVHQQLHRKTGCLDRHQRCFERLAMASYYWWRHFLRYACKPVAQHLVQNIQRCRCDAFENHVRLQFYPPRRKYILLYTIELSHAPVLFCL